jgi:hypothetical protein
MVHTDWCPAPVVSSIWEAEMGVLVELAWANIAIPHHRNPVTHTHTYTHTRTNKKEASKSIVAANRVNELDTAILFIDDRHLSGRGDWMFLGTWHLG